MSCFKSVTWTSIITLGGYNTIVLASATKSSYDDINMSHDVYQKAMHTCNISLYNYLLLLEGLNKHSMLYLTHLYRKKQSSRRIDLLNFLAGNKLKVKDYSKEFKIKT